MLPRRLLLLFMIAATVQVFAAERYHLWYDENGQAVYSQFAPGGGRESKRVGPPPPPAESPEQARARLQQRLQQFEDNREDRELAAEQTAKIQDEAKLKRQRCELARQNMALLNGPARRLFQTEDGIRRLTEEERQAKRTEMQQIIDSDCE